MMLKIFGIILFCVLSLIAYLQTYAAENMPQTVAQAPYVLHYQGKNKWVGAADRQPLTALLAALKTTPMPEVNMLQVVLPTEGRDLAILRLEVLQEIIDKSTDRSSLMVEIEGDSPANTLTVIYPAAQ